MNAITIGVAVYIGGVALVWAYIGYSMTRPGAQSQHGAELIGCAAAFLWPLAPFLWLASKIRKGDG